MIIKALTYGRTATTKASACLTNRIPIPLQDIKILGEIYRRILSRQSSEQNMQILDIGFGTGTLAARLYDQGLTIWGQDFSQKMLIAAQQKMPDANLYLADFSLGLADELKLQTYDAVIATYSLHHLTDERKISLLQELLQLLNSGGAIYIGDVAFETEAALMECKTACGDLWDDDEIYFVMEKLQPCFSSITFTPYSGCAGLIEIEK